MFSQHKYTYRTEQWLTGLRQAMTLIILQNYPYNSKQWLWSACTNTNTVLSNDSDRSAPNSAMQWLISLHKYPYSAKQWFWSTCAKQWPWSSCTNTVPINDSNQPAQIPQHVCPYPSTLGLTIHRTHIAKAQYDQTAQANPSLHWMHS